MTVALLGDSLTYGWLTEAPGAYRAAFAPHDVHNFGVPGDETRDVLRRLRAGDLDACRPAWVVLLAGTNDLGSGATVAETVAGIRACADEIGARYPRASLTVVGILPRGDGDGVVAQMGRIAAVNAAIARLCEDGGLAFADFSPLFLDVAGGLRVAYYDADLLHLSPAGYRAWAPGLAGVVGAARAYL